MDNEKLTTELISLGKQLVRIEENTSCLPQFKIDFQKMCIEVHDNTQCREAVEEKFPDIVRNTQFRKNSIKIMWVSGGAVVTSIIAFVFSLLGLKK